MREWTTRRCMINSSLIKTAPCAFILGPLRPTMVIHMWWHYACCSSSKIHVFSLNVRPFLRPDFSNFFALTSQVEVDRFYLSPASPLVFSLLTQECCCPAGRPGVLPGLPCFHKRLFLDNMRYDPAGSLRVILHFLLSNKRLLVDDRCCNPAGRPPAIPHSPNEVWNPNEV